MLGLRNYFKTAADVAITSNVVPATIGLASPIAKNEVQHLRWWVPISVGATGGVRFQIITPAGISYFVASYNIVNTGAATEIRSVDVASAVVTNALANAGNDLICIEATIINGANAGSVDLQIAQNTSDVLTMTVLKGSVLEVVKTTT